MNTMSAMSDLLRRTVPAHVCFQGVFDDHLLTHGPQCAYWDPATGRTWHAVPVENPRCLIEMGWLPIGDFARAWHLVDAYQHSYKRDIEQQGIALMMEMKEIGTCDAIKLGIAIHRSSREHGKWQASVFDRRGFYNHTTHESAIHAVSHALAQGFDLDGEQHLQEVFQPALKRSAA